MITRLNYLGCDYLSFSVGWNYRFIGFFYPLKQWDITRCDITINKYGISIAIPLFRIGIYSKNRERF